MCQTTNNDWLPNWKGKMIFSKKVIKMFVYFPDTKVLFGNYHGHIQHLAVYSPHAPMTGKYWYGKRQHQAVCHLSRIQRVVHNIRLYMSMTNIHLLVRIGFEYFRPNVIGNVLVNTVAWAPYEYGLMLACGSSDGSISILSSTGMNDLSMLNWNGLVSFRNRWWTMDSEENQWLSSCMWKYFVE